MEMPESMMDLVRFLADYAIKVNDVRCETSGMSPEEAKEHIIMKFPVLQGMRETMAIKSIGEQPYNREKIPEAVEWLLLQSAQQINEARDANSTL